MLDLPRFTVIGGDVKVHIPAPLLWFLTPIIFLAFETFSRKHCFSLLSVLFGRFPFHAPFYHWSFPSVLFVFSAGVFFAAGFSSSSLSFLSFFVVVPCRSFFSELISAVIATIFSCSSVGVPPRNSLHPRAWPRILFSARTIRFLGGECGRVRHRTDSSGL